MKILKSITAVGLLLLTFLSFNASAQMGELRGTITDSLTGNPIDGVIVSISEKGYIKTQVTDEKGEYSFKPVTPGQYTVTFTVFGKPPYEVKGVTINAESMRFLDQHVGAGITIRGLDITPDEYKVDMKKDPGITTITSVDLPRLAGERGVIEPIAYTVPRVINTGKGLSLSGSRPDATQYYIDGVKVIGELSIPQRGIEEITVINGGLPAKYGDTTSGVVLITTKSFN